jgi:hypothetical protein
MLFTGRNDTAISRQPSAHSAIGQLSRRPIQPSAIGHRPSANDERNCREGGRKNFYFESVDRNIFETGFVERVLFQKPMADG